MAPEEVLQRTDLPLWHHSPQRHQSAPEQATVGQFSQCGQPLSRLKLEEHPDKTFIGRVEKGFDFLGYHFSRSGLLLAAKTVANAVEKMHRLYEQKQRAPERAAALDDYLCRWVRWVYGGLASSNGALTIKSNTQQTKQTQPQQE